jgi:hypothetical protein
MKNIALFLTFVLTVMTGVDTYAQGNVPKDVLLNTLNGVNSLKLSNLKTTQLMAYNKAYVDKVYDISDSDKTEKDKEIALKALSGDTEEDLTDLLGKSSYRKYVNLMEKQMKPLIKKSKYLKYLY